MKVQTYNVDILHCVGTFYHFLHVLHGDAELVLGESGCDVCMSMSANIRVDAEGYIGGLARSNSQLLYNLQFGNRLHVEAGDAFLQSEVNLPVALAYAGIHHLVSRKACFDSRLYFAATHAVGTKAILAYYTQYLRVGICFYSIMNVKIVMLITFLFYNL